MAPKSTRSDSVQEKLSAAELVLQELKGASSPGKKLEILLSNRLVEAFLQQSTTLKTFVAQLDSESASVLTSILAIGQGPIVFSQLDQAEHKLEALQRLLNHFRAVEKDYAFMGGIVGYYQTALSLIVKKKDNTSGKKPKCTLKAPPGIHLDGSDERGKHLRRQTIRWGLEHLPLIAHIYPIGGAGERLDLRDEKTGESLPVAYLQMGGISLLEGMVRDLQATEFLYWKLYGKQLVVPIAMMTSVEKENATHIESICHQASYFGRPPESFTQFIQPLVPVITEKGDFSLSAPLQLVLKPGGHGVLWKLAEEQGVFDWFRSQNKDKLVVRQINNPIANTDGGIIAFSGIGCKQEKMFGFLSCNRLLNASEGMLVLKESVNQNKFDYCMTNVEYTDFSSEGIDDSPTEEAGLYSVFPANTNILFADMKAVRQLSQKTPLPGILINMKSKVPFLDEQGALQEVFGGRLECMMQNIADSIVDEFPHKLAEGDGSKLRCYIAYGRREQVISVTKKKYCSGKSPLETPEGCFYDTQKNAYDLLSTYGQMKLPPLGELEEFIQKSPPFIVRYHPALGPLYEVIRQKIRGGTIVKGSELLLEIAELDMEMLDLQGSLAITAKNILGHWDERGCVQYSIRGGKCELKNVRVVNRGINWKAKNQYWKNEIERHERLEIVLYGDGEFMASDVTFEGAQRIEVPVGTRLEVTMVNGVVQYQSRPISKPTWQWDYSFSPDDGVIIRKKK